MISQFKTIKVAVLVIFLSAFFINLQSNIGENTFLNTVFAQTSGSEGESSGGSGGECDEDTYKIDYAEDCVGFFKRKIDCKVSQGNCCHKGRIGQKC